MSLILNVIETLEQINSYKIFMMLFTKVIIKIV